MGQKFQFLTALLLLITIQLAASDKTNPSAKGNPLFLEFNQPIDFENLTAEDIPQATDLAISKAKEELQNLYNINDSERTFENTMAALDDILDRAGSVSNIIYLMGQSNPDDSIRANANESVLTFSKFFNDVSLDENLYKAVKNYAETGEAKNLTGYKKKFVEETIRDFERNGFALPKEKRDELKLIQNKIDDLGLQFAKNIAEENDYLIVEESDMEGLDEEYKKNHKTDNGKYKIDLTYPSYIPFMKFSKSEKARKELYFKYCNRASPENLEILKDLIIERQKMANLLGYKTYAEYRVADRMAKTVQNVWDFEHNLTEKVKIKAKEDYAELLETKRKYLNDNSLNVIQPWESSFYNNLLLKNKYQLDQQVVKEYFELNNVREGLFKIAQHLFDVQFKRAENASVWHKDVEAFDVLKDGKTIARFYLDLYPRPNKYSHAACFPMIKGKQTINGYQMPVAALECNFPKPTKDRPALMFQSEAETFFHEFGHVLHNMLTEAELSSFSGTSVARDFVEAPSQIFENWVWNYDALKLFAKNYKTGEVLPKDLFDKMLAAKNVGSGLSTLQQIYYGTIDFTLYDKYDPYGNKTTTDVIKELQNSITLYPFLDGTHMQTAFGHLYGYGASYYGYLWSLVYAQDMFSVFEKNGVMDEETGLRYRNIILAQGANKKEIDLVKEFLGREPNQEAFLRSLGLEEK